MPVSSLIHTLPIRRQLRRFIENDNIIDAATHLYGMDATLNDDDFLSMKTPLIALSLREGFKNGQFGLTGFVNFDKRQLNPARHGSGTHPSQSGRRRLSTTLVSRRKMYDEFSTYVGAELSKKQGSILTYDARGELLRRGDDVGGVQSKASANHLPALRQTGPSSVPEPSSTMSRLPSISVTTTAYVTFFWWDQSLTKSNILPLKVPLN